jgi:hypothetical protein
MGDVLRIAAGERADALCIADALASHHAGLEFDDPAWVVVVQAVNSAVLLTEVLDAVSACLQEHTIASVTVTVDEQTYVMEGAAP